MEVLLVTPRSEADLQLLTSLLRKMKIKVEVLPASAAGARRRPSAKACPVPTAEQLQNPLLPRNEAERNLVEAIEEMKEVMAGRKPAMSLKQFLDELE